MTRRFLQIAVFGALVVFGLAYAANIVFGDHSDNVDVTGAGAVVDHDGAVFIQGPLPTSAGTGLIDPFLTDGGGGSQDVTRSYNTDFGAQADFDMVFGGDRTHSLNLAAVPEQEYDGVVYKEFVLDINKAPGGSPYLAMNELQLWLTDNASLTGYDLTTYSFPSGATKIYDLDEGPDGDIAVLMDYSLESGSGASDLTWLVPLEVFGDLVADDGDCTYGNTDCTTYIVLFNEYGNYVEPDADADKWVNNDGFEEWGTVLRPVVEVTKDATGTFDRTVDWTIEKSVDPDTHDLFAGGPAGNSTYEITVTKSEKIGNVAASGSITVYNPTGGNGNPIEEDINAVILSVEDVITQGALSTTATVDCGVDFPYTLNAGDSLACTYTAAPGTATDGINTATATIEGLPIRVAGEPVIPTESEFSGSADLAFTEQVIGFDEINVDDTNDLGDFGPVSSTTTHTYDGVFDCADVTYVNGKASYEVPNTATIVETGLDDDANVTVNCYAPVLVKDASAGYDERHDWDVVKTVSPTTQKAFAGDPVGYTWTIDVTETVVDEEFFVTGDIDVTNPAGSPGDMTVSLADVLDDGTVATVDCGGGSTSITVAPGATGTCSYSASPDDASATLNTATGTFNGLEYTATADVSFVKTVVNGSATVSDDEIGLNDEPVSGGDQFTAVDGDVCSSDQADYGDTGTYSSSDSNTATLVDAEGTAYESGATTNWTCYAPVLAKDATATYDERHDWDIEKKVTPLTQDAFAGYPVAWEWEITITETVVDQNFAVTGSIDVTNPAGSPGDMAVSLADVLDDSTVATVDCGGGATSVTVAPGATETCSYSASPDDASATLNTATGTFNGNDFVATAGVSFVTNVVNDDATWDDPYLGVVDEIAVDGVYTYPEDDVCSSDQAEYGADGTITVKLDNDALLVDEEGTEYPTSASTTYNCYAPLVDKTVDPPTFDQRREWSLTKTVAGPDPDSGYPGDQLDWTWTVTAVASDTAIGGSYEVTGVIKVTNPAPDPMTVTVTDLLDTGDAGIVDCDQIEPGAQKVVTIDAEGFALCSFDAVDTTDGDASSNTATATLPNDVSFDSDPVPFAFLVGETLNETATLADPRFSYSQEISGNIEVSFDEFEVCSRLWETYGDDGQYGETEVNTATLTPNGPGEPLSETAETSWLCEAATINLLKLTNGTQHPTQVWSFELYTGGYDGTLVASDSTPPALLDFGGPALRPDTTYTLCERNVPAGWSTTWYIDVNGDGLIDGGDTIVVPYNPDAGSNQNLGNLCIDIGAETGIPLDVGVLKLIVDNDQEGGDPRTPGYWKNWNRCTGGGQQYTADANGGWAEGFWLLEDILDPSIGGGITWDDILTNDDFEYDITLCEDAVDILDHRTTDDGKKVASQPLHNLARNLLAAQLNHAAGACTTPEVQQWMMDAEALLDDKHDFDGTLNPIPKKSADAKLANQLADYLDQYNNGLYCGATVS